MAKILLVEDDNNLKDIYSERLMAEGYDVISASDGEEALQMASQHKPDLIISDVMMPKISGFDMLDILRQTPETKDIKIIMMTALSQAEDKSRADKLGADKYLVKSQVTLEDVARVVHDTIGDSKENSQSDTANSAQVQSAQGNDAASGSVQSAAPAPEPSPPTNPVVAPPIDPSATPAPQSAQTDNPQPAMPAPEPSGPAPAAQDDQSDKATQQQPDDPITPPQTQVPQAAPNDIVQPAMPTPEPSSTITPTSPDVTATSSQQSAQTENPQPAMPAPEPSGPAPAAQGDQSDNATQQQPINPISAVANDASQSSNSDQTQPTVEAQSTSQESANVQSQIDNFVNQDSQVSEHTEPVNEPTQQQVIHAQNANETPDVIKSDVASGTANRPTEPQQADDVNNPMPVSSRQKVIQPMNDISDNKENIYKLYEQQMAQDASSANNPIQDSSTSNVSPQSTDPQVTNGSENQVTQPEPPNTNLGPQNGAPQESQVVQPQFGPNNGPDDNSQTTFKPNDPNNFAL